MDEQSPTYHPGKLNFNVLVSTSFQKPMPPSPGSTTLVMPRQRLIRPRSLSLHATTTAANICSSNSKTECNNHNQNICRASKKQRKAVLGDCRRGSGGIRDIDSKSSSSNLSVMDENSNSNPGGKESLTKLSGFYEKPALTIQIPSNNENAELETRRKETVFSASSSATTPAPIPVSISPIEKSLSSRQVLRKTPSTPGSSSRKPTLSRQSSKTATPVWSAPLPSPTGRSRLALPTSPGHNTAVAGVHSKKHAVHDQNPFGADLVRYLNDGGLTSNSGRGSGNSETGTGSFYAMNNSNEESALLGRPANAKSAHCNGSNNKTPETKLDSPVTVMEKSAGSVIFSKDAWPESNNAGGNHAGGGSRFLRNRFSTRRIRNRLMQKDGECNISLHNVPRQKAKYFSDIFTTLVEVKWRWCLLIFALGFLLSWLLFGTVYYTIMYTHGDFEHAQNDTNWKFCVYTINNFVSVFMFSLESQHTIGYGSRYPSEECPLVVATVCLQSMVGVMIQTLMAGIVFAKLARAKKRAETLIFSKHAVVCMRDGQLCFLFRVGDMRKSQLAEAHVRLQMISKRITNEGELLPFHQFDMNVGYDAGLDRIFVVWPITICHVIDENSPLYEYSADDLATARFEIIAILEGVVPSIGTTTQARTSYLPQEIIWGSRFEKLVTYQRENGEYRIDFSKFHKTYTQETPTCSARDLDLLREAGLNLEEVYHVEGDEQAENQGLTPYSTVDSRVEPSRPSILPSKEEQTNSVIEIIEMDASENNLPTMDEEIGETGHLLPPPSASVLMTMSPAERKASIAAAAAAFRKNKSLSESTRKASLAAYSRFRKPSIKASKVGVSEYNSIVVSTPSRQTPQSTPTHNIRILRHASSTGSVAVPHLCAAVGCSTKSRPSSILREHDIM